MADQAAAAAAAAAADLAQAAADIQNNMGSKARLVLPVFEGKLDGQATRNFLSKVDGYSAVTRLTPQETAQAVAFALLPGSAADHWLTNLKEREEAVASAWDTLRPRMVTRFCPALTATEKAAAVDGCRQGRNEEILTFRDQCESTQLLLDRDMDPVLKANPNVASYTAHYEGGILGLFLRGMREEGGLKSHVNAALGCTTLNEFVEAAVRYERHITKIKVVVAELHQGQQHDESEEESDEREIAALRARQASRRTAGKKSDGARSGGSSSGPWRAKGKANTSAQSGPTTPRLCWSCQSPTHLNRDCPNKKPFRGGGGGGAGGNNAFKGNSAALNEMVANAGMTYLLQQQQEQQQIQYEHASNTSGRFSNIDSLDYFQRPNFV
jgi:hypothetical protein